VSEEKVSEDLESRVDALDQREVLVQKELVRLQERVDWLMKERREEKREEGISNRWKIGLIVGTMVSVTNLILNLMGVL